MKTTKKKRIIKCKKKKKEGGGKRTYTYSLYQTHVGKVFSDNKRMNKKRIKVTLAKRKNPQIQRHYKWLDKSIFLEYH